MIPHDRAALFDTVTELCHQYPNWRFGQRVSNGSGWADADSWDIPDERLLAAVRAHWDHVNNRAREVKT